MLFGFRVQRIGCFGELRRWIRRIINGFKIQNPKSEIQNRAVALMDNVSGGVVG
jgi:hypothetical protein